MSSKVVSNLFVITLFTLVLFYFSLDPMFVLRMRNYKGIHYNIMCYIYCKGNLHVISPTWHYKLDIVLIIIIMVAAGNSELLTIQSIPICKKMLFFKHNLTFEYVIKLNKLNVVIILVLFNIFLSECSQFIF